MQLDHLLAATNMLTDQQRLYLIDMLTDQMDSADVTDAIVDVLPAAFEISEAGTTGTFAPHFPHTGGDWADYRARRDMHMRNALAFIGRSVA